MDPFAWQPSEHRGTCCSGETEGRPARPRTRRSSMRLSRSRSPPCPAASSRSAAALAAAAAASLSLAVRPRALRAERSRRPHDGLDPSWPRRCEATAKYQYAPFAVSRRLPARLLLSPRDGRRDGLPLLQQVALRFTRSGEARRSPVRGPGQRGLDRRRCPTRAGSTTRRAGRGSARCHGPSATAESRRLVAAEWIVVDKDQNLKPTTTAQSVRRALRRSDAGPRARHADPLRPARLALEEEPQRPVRPLEPHGEVPVPP